MREFSVHGIGTGGRWARRTRLDAARTLALEVENDHIQRLLDEERTPALNDLLGNASSAS